MVKTDNLTFQYNKGKQVFNFPNISLENSESLLILGKSGIGKTTFLHLLAGLLKPNTGTINIDSVSINSLNERKLDRFRGDNIGLVFQKKHAIQSLNIIENLQARLLFSNRTINDNSIDSLLSQLELTEFKSQNINKLSEGQLQRLGIALSVIHSPKVILADEPTSSLDDENCKRVIDLLKAQALQANANLIVITHDHRVKPHFEKSITL